MSILDRISTRLPVGGLGRRSLSSGIWSLAELGVGHMLRLASNLILTRLLAPEAFGLMAMVTTIQIGVAMLSDLGVRQSVIRAPNAEDPLFLRTAWTVGILRGAAVALLILACGAGLWLLGPRLAAPGTVYTDPVLPFLVMAAAVTMQMEALSSVNVFLAHRRMEMRRVALLEISAQVLAIVVMVGIASQWPSVWALLIGGMSASALRVLLSHLIFAGPRMRLAWDRETSRELWQFGRWIIGSSGLGFVSRYADRLILGALMPASLFGLYAIALLWVQAYGIVVSKLASQVGLPLLSEIHRSRPADLPRLFRRYARLIDLFCVAGFLLFLLGSDQMVALLYTDDYADVSRFMPLLGVIILMQRFSLFPELLLIDGNSFLLMLTTGVSALALCAAIPLGYLLLGLPGAIAGGMLSALAGITLQMLRVSRQTGLGLREDWLWVAAVPAITAAIIAVLEFPSAP